MGDLYCRIGRKKNVQLAANNMGAAVCFLAGVALQNLESRPIFFASNADHPLQCIRGTAMRSETRSVDRICIAMIAPCMCRRSSPKANALLSER